MATTTPNYGWTVPTSTDLVKDGATAIETLGDAIDASMNTALGTKKAGMVLLNTTSFSGVSSQSVNDVFSATYDSYKILYRLTSGTASAQTNFRLRVSGADDSNNVYRAGGNVVSLESAIGAFESNLVSTSWYFGSYLNGTYPIFTTLDLSNPFTANQTVGHMQSVYNSGIIAGVDRRLNFTNTTSFTGFSLIASSGNITGSVSVYGYNK